MMTTAHVPQHNPACYRPDLAPRTWDAGDATHCLAFTTVAERTKHMGKTCYRNGLLCARGRWLSQQDPDAVIEEVAAEHGLLPRDLKGKRQDKRALAARREAAKRMRAAGMLIKNIAAALNRHHSTIVSALREAK